MTDMDRRYAAYDHVCRVYEEYLDTLELACQKGCAACCTINVPLTSLEACRIVEYMEQTGQTKLYERLRAAVGRKRYQPQITRNRLARMIQQGEDVPEEASDPEWGGCPLLTGQACPVYEVRPFACRCLVSKTDCRTKGYARVDAFTVTVNDVMLQYIEHIDQPGFTGNLVEMLLYMESAENRRNYLSGRAPAAPPENSLAHEPATVLLVSPEEKAAIAPLLTALNQGGH